MFSQGPPRVYVAMSGGVDSSVTAALLKERGFDVTGVHIKMWSDPEIPCNFKRDREDAIRVAAHLGIPFETWDFTKEYRASVVDYMIREYREGRTPNPDVMCNRHIKFGAFLAAALERGADFVATGHYVRLEPELSIINDQFSSNTERIENFAIENSLKIVNCKLKIAKDTNKDQSYFLWTLTQDQLKHCLFPIGEFRKPEVRRLAKKFGLPTAGKEESQGICFIGEIDLNQFLKKFIPVSRGRVLTTSGKDIGEHEGLQFYTIGQRHGIGVGGRPRKAGEPRPERAGGIPYYVAAKDFSRNTLVVAEGPYDKGLFRSEIAVSDVHWILGQAPDFASDSETPGNRTLPSQRDPLDFPRNDYRSFRPFVCEARIRYRQALQMCTVRIVRNVRNVRDVRDEQLEQAKHRLPDGQGSNKRSPTCRTGRDQTVLTVIFDSPQRAVTPGQSIVFYFGEEMIGGGIIV